MLWIYGEFIYVNYSNLFDELSNYINPQFIDDSTKLQKSYATLVNIQDITLKKVFVYP